MSSSPSPIALASLEPSTSNSNPFYVFAFQCTIRDVVGNTFVGEQTALLVALAMAASARCRTGDLEEGLAESMFGSCSTAAGF